MNHHKATFPPSRGKGGLGVNGSLKATAGAALVAAPFSLNGRTNLNCAPVFVPNPIYLVIRSRKTDTSLIYFPPTFGTKGGEYA